MSARRLHFWLGLVCAVPLFAWASSGLLGALPRASTTGVRYEKVDLARLKISPQEAARLAGADLRFSALTLEQANGRLRWRLVSGPTLYQVDAETGETKVVPPASPYFSQAHFFFFAGPLQQPLLLGGTTALLALLASGLWLAARSAGFGRRKPGPPRPAPPPPSAGSSDRSPD